MEFHINRNTTIESEVHTEAVEKAIAALERDILKSCEETEEQGTSIVLRKQEQKPECFRLVMTEQGLEIQANDEMGFIYGVYEVSRLGLGIMPFWFWNNQKIVPQQRYVITEDYQSRPFAVRFRGWFINDEVLLQNWTINGNKEEAWEMAFEALLRCGGNMVIPGTDKNARTYAEIASTMGLYLTHHHAEPLGAEMFARAYPKLTASYSEHKEKFEALWKEGIERQKDKKVIWTLGFRGQGDCPFWEQDPKYQSNESRGALMSKLIKLQYDMVRAVCPDAPCCTNLYGETMELYREGYLKIPEDVIKIWADNGYGKMVTRRQGNHNPRVCSLPTKEDGAGHGIYYHVSFYDLQAANHITMLPNSAEFVLQELNRVMEHGGNDFWLINSSNIKPHVYFLDLIANIWKGKGVESNTHRKEYVQTYYGAGTEHVEDCFRKYAEYAITYGPHEDDHAGEQFLNHVARILISQYMREKEKPAEELIWATDADNLQGQVKWYQKLCEQGRSGYAEYQRQCEMVALSLSEEAETLFRDSLLLQVQILSDCVTGACYLCESIQYAEQKEYEKAFYAAGKARKAYLSANEAMKSREHGKWIGFYQNECLTDVKQTAWVLEGLMSYLRNLGDGPHYFKWQREFIYPEEDRKIMLLLNTENHLKDDELFQLMEQKYGK